MASVYAVNYDDATTLVISYTRCSRSKALIDVTTGLSQLLKLIQPCIEMGPLCRGGARGCLDPQNLGGRATVHFSLLIVLIFRGWFRHVQDSICLWPESLTGDSSEIAAVTRVGDGVSARFM